MQHLLTTKLMIIDKNSPKQFTNYNLKSDAIAIALGQKTLHTNNFSHKYLNFCNYFFHLISIERH